jgi:hypothetical protein
MLDWSCVVLYVLAMVFNSWDLGAHFGIFGIGVAFWVGCLGIGIASHFGYAWKESVSLVRSDISVRF